MEGKGEKGRKEEGREGRRGGWKGGRKRRRKGETAQRRKERRTQRREAIFAFCGFSGVVEMVVVNDVAVAAAETLVENNKRKETEKEKNGRRQTA